MRSLQCKTRIWDTFSYLIKTELENILMCNKKPDDWNSINIDEYNYEEVND